LARGYSITTRAGTTRAGSAADATHAGDGRAIVSAASVRPGEEIETRLADGSLRSRVTEVRP
jgi:exonuclease VII large subunit